MPSKASAGNRIYCVFGSPRFCCWIFFRLANGQTGPLTLRRPGRRPPTRWGCPSTIDPLPDGLPGRRR